MTKAMRAHTDATREASSSSSSGAAGGASAATLRSRRRRSVVGARASDRRARVAIPPPHEHVCLAPTSTRRGAPARPSSRTTKALGPGRWTRKKPGADAAASASSVAASGLTRQAARRSERRDMDGAASRARRAPRAARARPRARRLT